MRISQDGEKEKGYSQEGRVRIENHPSWRVLTLRSGQEWLSNYSGLLRWSVLEGVTQERLHTREKWALGQKKIPATNQGGHPKT